MDTTKLSILVLLAAANLLLAIVNLVRAVLLRRKPLVDRLVLTGTVTEVFRHGTGVRVTYALDGKSYTVLQINKGVNALDRPVSSGDQIQIHVNPFRHSNITLTPRPVRDEGSFLTWIWVQAVLVPLAVIALLV